MYSKIVEQLLEPILLDKIDEIEIRELNKNETESEILILAPKEFFKKIVGKNGNIIQALNTLINIKADMNGQRVKITISEL